jgi:hypothetical protein
LGVTVSLEQTEVVGGRYPDQARQRYQQRGKQSQAHAKTLLAYYWQF